MHLIFFTSIIFKITIQVNIVTIQVTSPLSIRSNYHSGYVKHYQSGHIKHYHSGHIKHRYHLGSNIVTIQVQTHNTIIETPFFLSLPTHRPTSCDKITQQRNIIMSSITRGLVDLQLFWRPTTFSQ